MKKDVVVVGGGASGMVAAIVATQAGCSVVLYEKQKSLGKKIAASGNGQCNVSNANVSIDNYFGENPLFVRNILSRFSYSDLSSFFLSLGVLLTTKDDGRAYPYNYQSRTVIQALEAELKRLHVTVKTLSRVDDIVLKKGGGFSVVATTFAHDGTVAEKSDVAADAVLCATGGLSYPKLGGSRSGYKFAEKFGHRIVDSCPSILPLNIDDQKLQKLQGVRWDVKLAVSVSSSKSKEVAAAYGELLFTSYGISGPVTLDISGATNRALLAGDSVVVTIDLFPYMSHDELSATLAMLYRSAPLHEVLDLLLKESMGEYVAGRAEIDPKKRADQLSEGEKKALVKTLKSIVVLPGDPRSISEATVTAGGVAVSDINPKTCESKKVKGLYFVGELLDIDGACGGYNLHFAWATGVVAAQAASTPSS